MRKILFRGKTKAHNKWVYGWYCGKILNHDMSSTEESSQIIDDKTLYWHTCEPETCGQFTGLTDKNGKKIFEGDIVQGYKTEFTPPKKYRKPFVATMKTSLPNSVEEYYSPFEHFTEKVKWEIIGNIHDNPELLENP